MIMIAGIIAVINSSTVVFGQTIMTLDSDLKTNSTPMEAKRKGMSSVGKYEFGPFRIVSGKGGSTVTKSHKKMLSFTTKSESSSKSSFVFVANNSDTINITTSTNNNLSETEVGNLGILNKSTDNYLATISPSADSTAWKMLVVFNMGEDVKGNFNAQGTLTNGKITIQIREVRQWEDGKTPLMNAICGYEFYLENSSIGAVQSSIDTFKKKFVWLNNNLEEQLKSVLAAASAALMVHTDSQLSSMD